MDKILLRKPSDNELKSMGVESWPVWEKASSRFNWYYDEKETCFILEGSARVTPENGESVEFGPGDMVTFPKGMNCVWEITSDIRKHYKFG